MLDMPAFNVPTSLPAIVVATQKLTSFTGESGPLTGTLLRTLAASKPGGMFLELGTGTGMATAWIADGLDEASKLITVEKSAKRSGIAQQFLGNDTRITFTVMAAEAFLLSQQEEIFDVIFADAGIGKFSLLPETLRLLKPGGFYIVDHLQPQPSDLEDHEYVAKVNTVVVVLEQRRDLHICKMNWSSGLIVAVKRAGVVP